MHMRRAGHGSTPPLNRNVMRHGQGNALNPLRLIAPIVAFAASLVLSFPIFMGGIGDLSWNLFVLFELYLLYGVCGFTIGACLPRWWFLAVGVAWLPLMLFFESLGYIRIEDPPLDTVLFTFSPLVPIVSGYLGSVVSRKWWIGVNNGDAA
jgi:hypothetical protein